MAYAIVDNTGAVYAHDIRDRFTAECIISEYNIPQELEGEIIEQ
jgi:hypothetical protein